jgi:hypothetical protein
MNSFTSLVTFWDPISDSAKDMSHFQSNSTVVTVAFHAEVDIEY